MKTVNRTEFLTLPAGTIYSRLKPNSTSIESLCCKTSGPDESDWVEQDLLDALQHYSLDKVDELLTPGGGTFGLDYTSRAWDRSFDEKQQFVVWEQADIDKLVNFLQEPA